MKLTKENVKKALYFTAGMLIGITVFFYFLGFKTSLWFLPAAAVVLFFSRIYGIEIDRRLSQGPYFVLNYAGRTMLEKGALYGCPADDPIFVDTSGGLEACKEHIEKYGHSLPIVNRKYQLIIMYNKGTPVYERQDLLTSAN